MKTQQKMIDFLLDEHELKKCEKLFQNIVFFGVLSCQNTVNTTVFGWFALRTGREDMKKTVVFAVHLKPPVEKTSQNTLLSTRSLKNTVNSHVFGRFSSLTLPKRRKYQCFFFYKHKNRAKYSVFGRFWPKIFDQEQQQQQQQEQEEHMTPLKLGAGGPCRGAAWITYTPLSLDTYNIIDARLSTVTLEFFKPPQPPWYGTPACRNPI